MPVGLLGGSFDPPHRGHLHLARAALATGEVDEVWLIPARQPPHKRGRALNAPHHRLAMTALLCREDPRLHCNPCEIERPGPSYTVETLRQLRSAHPATSYRLIIGADMIMDFDAWKEAETILALAPPLVAERPGSPLPADLVAEGPPGLAPEDRRVLQEGRFPLEPCGISSSAIRQRLRQSESVSADLTPAVIDYIAQHKLYD